MRQGAGAWGTDERQQQDEARGGGTRTDQFGDRLVERRLGAHREDGDDLVEGIPERERP
jgi:hypothetical protein